MITEFTIKRSIWLRGEDVQSLKGSAYYSYLLRPLDHKQCCVGQYLEACGVPRDQLFGEMFATDIKACPDWLQPKNNVSSNLYGTNDNHEVEDRESKIAALFASQGITVTFED